MAAGDDLSMRPIAFFVGDYPVRYAGLLYVVGAMGMLVYARQVATRRRWDPDLVLPGVAFVVTAAYLGARVLGVINSDVDDGFSLRALLRPGNLSFFGGLALGTIVMVAYLRLVKLPVGAVADELSLAGPVLYALFRLGCFLNGDDYGRATTLPWGMTFVEGSPPTSERVHPVQLYEIAAMIPVALALVRRSRRGLPDGALAAELCVLMGSERFVADFFRVSGSQALSPAQWMALGLIAVGVVVRVQVMSRTNSGLA